MDTPIIKVDIEDLSEPEVDQLIKRGILLNSLIFKTNLQKNTVLKLMRQIASYETCLLERRVPCGTRLYKRQVPLKIIRMAFRGILTWKIKPRSNSSRVPQNFLNSLESGANAHIVIKKKLIWVELVSCKDEFH